MKFLIVAIFLAAILFPPSVSANHWNYRARFIWPTRIPTLTPTRISTPTPTKTPTQTPTPTLTPTGTQSPVTSDEVKTFIMGEINSYRKSQGLTEVKTDQYTCDFAKVRAYEISKAFNHDGFSQRIQSKSLPYPSYSYVNENIAMNSNYRNVVQSWINSSGHARNMRADTSFVCVERYGNFYAYEGWRQ